MASLSRRTVLGGLTAIAALGSGGLVACGDDEPDATDEGAPRPFRYGDDGRQVADLHLPPGATTDPLPVAVLFHGGFWQPPYDRTLLRPVADDLTGRDWAVWNVDYRPVGEGGGWPATFDDAAAAVDHLTAAAERHPLDLDRVVTLGHSAGGTLALWAAARGGLPASAPGAGPAVEPVGAASVAGVNNLVSCWFEDLGQGACGALMGGSPNDDGDRYRLASPEDRLPLGLPQLLVTSAADVIVPSRQSSAYAEKAKEAGDEVTLLAADDADHFQLVEPTHPAWARTAEALRRLLPS